MRVENERVGVEKKRLGVEKKRIEGRRVEKQRMGVEKKRMPIFIHICAYVDIFLT